MEVKLTDIMPNPNQPRKQFDVTSLNELAHSIEQYGLINPITLAWDESMNSYIIVAGERRFRAHELLGREVILSIITAGKLEEKALIENIQRDDLNPVEEAIALARLKEHGAYTQAELADVVGKARSTITNTLGINRLPDQIKRECIQSGFASKSMLIEISKMNTEEEQLRFWNQVKRSVGPSTVRSTRSQRTKKPKDTFSRSVRERLIENLISFIDSSGLTRLQAVEAFDSSEPRISLLVNREIDKFSVDALLDMHYAAGLVVNISFTPHSSTDNP